MLLNSSVPFSFCAAVLPCLDTVVSQLFSSVLFLWYGDHMLYIFAISESKLFFQEWRVIWVPALGFQR